MPSTTGEAKRPSATGTWLPDHGSLDSSGDGVEVFPGRDLKEGHPADSTLVPFYILRRKNLLLTLKEGGLTFRAVESLGL